MNKKFRIIDIQSHFLLKNELMRFLSVRSILYYRK